MDSLTHIVLGACIGDAIGGKKVGRRAMMYGALAQSLPDIDFIATLWLNNTENLLGHRGFTHSILFALIMIPIMAVVADKLEKKKGLPLRTWFVLFTVEVFTHLFLDGFNNYGVGWLEPFDHRRYSLHILYVADPFFSICPAIAFIVLLTMKSRSPKRRFWSGFGIVIPFMYLMYAFANKFSVESNIKKDLTAQNLPGKLLFTTPAPMNSWLWFVVTGNDSGYYIGYRSVFESGKTSFNYFPKNANLLVNYLEDPEVIDLLRFSQGYYTVEQKKDSVIFYDLRFGQIVGWHDPKEKFAFYYYLTHKDENDLVVQRGRFTRWNRETFASLMRRIRGDKN